jgi:uncharacterized RDD family membrane protein YckC
MFQDQMLAHSNGTTNQKVQYVGFWPRAFAYSLDLIVLGSLSISIHHVITERIVSHTVSILAYLAYRFVFWVRFGATPGMLVLKQRIVCTNLQKIDAVVALRRVVASFVCDMMLYIPYISVAIDSRHQGLHDKFAHTFVVRSNSQIDLA